MWWGATPKTDCTRQPDLVNLVRECTHDTSDAQTNNHIARIREQWYQPRNIKTHVRLFPLHRPYRKNACLLLN